MFYRFGLVAILTIGAVQGLGILTPHQASENRETFVSEGSSPAEPDPDAYKSRRFSFTIVRFHWSESSVKIECKVTYHVQPEDKGKCISIPRKFLPGKQDFNTQVALFGVQDKYQIWHSYCRPLMLTYPNMKFAELCDGKSICWLMDVTDRINLDATRNSEARKEVEDTVVIAATMCYFDEPPNVLDTLTILKAVSELLVPRSAIKGQSRNILNYSPSFTHRIILFNVNLLLKLFLDGIENQSIYERIYSKDGFVLKPTFIGLPSK